MATQAPESWEPDLRQIGWWARLLLFAAATGGAIGLIGFLSGDLLICLFDWTGMIVIGTGLAAWTLPGMIRFGRRLGLPLGRRCRARGRADGRANRVRGGLVQRLGLAEGGR